MFYHQDFVRFFFIVVISFVPRINAYCKSVGSNPSFTGKPIVTQIDLITIRVSWKDLVSRVDCADYFCVKYWRSNDPNGYKMIYDLPTDQFNTTIKVTPRVLYTFQVIAKEDKGSGLFGGGIDYNKSPTTQFQTSRHNENVTPDINVMELRFVVQDNLEFTQKFKDILTGLNKT